MTLRKVLLIRHGQTDFNRERRLQGALPVPLNACGREQSRKLGCWLRPLALDALYASPRRRAWETAEIIAETSPWQIRPDERLSEINFGHFEGLTFAQVEAKYPAAYRKWDGGYRAYRVPGGESRLDVQRRMTAFWRDLADSPNIETAAVIGHSSAFMILLSGLFAHLPNKPMTNTSIATLARYEETWEIAGFGETPHL